MKKIICCILCFLLCFAFVGCKKSSEPSQEAETVVLDTPHSLSGKVVEIISPSILVVEAYGSRFIEQFGETVYVITYKADQWCVGDGIRGTFTTVQYPTEDCPYVQILTNDIQTPVYVNAPIDKPIIYLYPKVPTVVSVKVILSGELTCTYPAHGEEGWQNFTAYPDGTLVSPEGKEYYALYWEGVQDAAWDFSQGWCVRGEDTAEFLEWALAQQGLTPREANEFIVYWLPLMQENPYNVISFQTTAYTDGAVLEISPTPDSLLRVFMAYYSSDIAVDIAPQEFESFTREGFTVVEWGGSNVTNP